MAGNNNSNTTPTTHPQILILRPQNQPSRNTQPNLHSQSSRGVQTHSITPHTNQGVLTLTPYDPSTPFSSWPATTEFILYSFLDELKMRDMWTARPTEIQQCPRIKSINEQSDLDTIKPIMLSRMQHAEVQRHPGNRRRQP